MPKKSDPFAQREAKKYSNPIASREHIIDKLLEYGDPLTLHQLFKFLNLRGKQNKISLQKRLIAMVKDKQLNQTYGGGFWPQGHQYQVKGQVVFEKDEFMVQPDLGGPLIKLIIKEKIKLQIGDKVLVKMNIFEQTKSPIFEGIFIKILAKQPQTIVGRFVAEQDFNYVVSHDKNFVHNVLIPQGQENHAVSGDIVKIKLLPNPKIQQKSFGQVTKILGSLGDANTAVNIAVEIFKISNQWPDAVINTCKKFASQLTSQQIQGRVDLRRFPLVTIDGDDSKDFDDAIFCKPDTNGGWHLYIAIADVAAYVKPKTALDKEARLRGNSVYFPNTVIPMLPEKLSNKLCSLNPNVDRLCLVCEMHISQTGMVIQYQFYEGVMRSWARLTYRQVEDIIQGDNSKLSNKLCEIVKHIDNLYKLYQVLFKERKQRGAIEFETVETKFIFNKKRFIKDIVPVHRLESHRIIEELMLRANISAAKFLLKHHDIGIFRNHDGPTNEKLQELTVYLKSLGLNLPDKSKLKPKNYTNILEKIKSREDASIIQMMLLRSMGQAVYAAKNDGHFGLAYDAYAHFTSPIRRYPDLLVHRMIKTILNKKKSGQLFNLDRLINIAEHCSKTERRADDATRDVARLLKCQYLSKYVGDVFEGVIAGVTHFGFFVELKELFVDGLVHVNSLKTDYYIYDQTMQSLVGEISGEIFYLGKHLTVQVSRIDMDTRRIDFDLIRTYKNKKK